MNEPWYASKTKVGGVLIGISLIIGAVGRYLTGDYDIMYSLQAIATGIGIILTIVGIRNAIESTI